MSLYHDRSRWYGIVQEPSSLIEMFGFCYDQIGPPILGVKSAKENEYMENMGPDITFHLVDPFTPAS